MTTNQSARSVDLAVDATATFAAALTVNNAIGRDAIGAAIDAAAKDRDAADKATEVLLRRAAFFKAANAWHYAAALADAVAALTAERQRAALAASSAWRQAALTAERQAAEIVAAAED